MIQETFKHMKVGVFEADEIEEEILKKELRGVKLEFFNEHLSQKNYKKAVSFEGIVVFINSKIDKKLLDRLPKLKAIATLSTGMDHIDLSACKKRKIEVRNVPSYGEDTVAEHTFALILALSRNLIESDLRVKRGVFSPNGLRGFNLNGKTIGIVGLGKIGAYVAKIAQAFGMKIIGFSRHVDLELEKKYQIKYVSKIEKLLAESDIVSLNCPLTKETHHLINRKNIPKMKKGSMIINTARGAIIESEALIDALKSKRVAYAGLDVLEGEGMIKEEKELLFQKRDKNELKVALANHILLSFPNVLVTPHNAFNSVEALQRIGLESAKNIKESLKIRATTES